METLMPLPPVIDFIGDLHGHTNKLLGLLKLLGYEFRSGNWQHPAGHMLVFLGDYLSRGPDVPGTLRILRSLVEAGLASAILGNHEWNFIRRFPPFHEPFEATSYTPQHQADFTHNLTQLEGAGEDPALWCEWLSSLPFAIDGENFRAVHAYWDTKAMPRVLASNLRHPETFREAFTTGTELNKSLSLILNGPFATLPQVQLDAPTPPAIHKKIRLPWWETMPEPEPHSLARPLFFGHYQMNPEVTPFPLMPHAACLDFHPARQGPVTAYRFGGESQLCRENYVCYPDIPWRLSHIRTVNNNS